MFRASDNQWSYIMALVNERVLTEAELQYADDAIMGKREVSASNLINWLMGMPKDKTSIVGPGIYRHGDEHYLVREAARTGNRYASRLVIMPDGSGQGHEWRYIPGAITALSAGERLIKEQEEELRQRYPVIKYKPKP